MKIPTYISVKVDPYLKEQVVNLLKEFKDYFVWDYNENVRVKSRYGRTKATNST